MPVTRSRSSQLPVPETPEKPAVPKRPRSSAKKQKAEQNTAKNLVSDDAPKSPESDEIPIPKDNGKISSPEKKMSPRKADKHENTAMVESSSQNAASTDPAENIVVEPQSSFMEIDPSPVHANTVFDEKAVVRLLDVLDGRIEDTTFDHDLSKHSDALIQAASAGYLNSSRHLKLLREIAEKENLDVLAAVVKHLNYLPEWFLVKCLETIARPMIPLEWDSTKTFLRSLVRRDFDRKKMLLELKKVSFDSVLKVCKQLSAIAFEDVEVDDTCLCFSWISILVESHFTEWALADDAFEIMSNIHSESQKTMDDFFRWFEIQGQIKALLSASKDIDNLSRSDLKYWQGVIEF